jgi:hypothetical protein
VAGATRAAAAMSSTVTAKKPLAENSSRAASMMARRVSAA